MPVNVRHSAPGPVWARLAAAILAATAGLAAGRPEPASLASVACALGTHAAPTVLLSAVFADGYLPQDADEAIQLWNVGAAPVDLEGWVVTDGPGRATFPPGARLEAGAWLWLARDADPFSTSFGHPPDAVWGKTVDGVPRMATVGGGPSLANVGDAVRLLRPDGRVADAMVYGTPREQSAAGWEGAPVIAYRTPAIGAANQVLYRKLDPRAGRPTADTDTASDWASDPEDPLHGRRVRYPGWDVEARAAPRAALARGRWEVAVAPDALHAFLRRHLSAAAVSIDLLAYTFEHPDLAEALAERARAGARVRVLVDGAPAGGLSHAERWCLNRMAEAGAEVYYLAGGGDVKARYRSAHAKLALIDGRMALLGSENPGPGSAPSDDRSDGTLGRRGAWLATDAAAVVTWVAGIVADDLDPTRHVDVRAFQPRDPARGAPAPDFVPEPHGGGEGYEPIAPAPLSLEGAFEVVMITAPENALHPDALAGLLARAGGGDQVLVQQMREPLWWGRGPEEGPAALNPRPQAYLAAARRGARVRVLLDGFFDSPEHWNSNAATARALTAAARAEGLDLAARVGNPTGRGIHAKTVLVRLGEGAGAGHWVHLGSLNGSESAHKVNREAALQVRSEAIHGYLADVFAWDWAHSPAQPLLLPLLGR